MRDGSRAGSPPHQVRHDDAARCWSSIQYRRAAGRRYLRPSGHQVPSVKGGRPACTYTGWVVRSLLRFISLVVLTTIMGISTARVICLIPCGGGDTAQPAATAGAHCGHAQDAGPLRLSGSDPTCDSCQQLRLTDADRLANRTSPVGGARIAPTSPAAALRPLSAQLRAPAATAPDRRGSAPVPLPLRI